MSSPRLSHLLNIPASSRSFTTSARVGAGLSALARPVAEKISAEWKGTSMIGGTTKNFIGGQFVESKADKWLEVHDPVCYAKSCRLILLINHPFDP
jgi:malonate-semialdehyde dehydrogenase (acetylating)/methylmalonate-semialdehyde dehydrogenase